tara:strand:- start:685 stop:1032 length:348 start_codon:yes stop_codon:yes gene_type:complete
MNSKEFAINHIEYNLSQNNLNCLFVALSDTGKKMFSFNGYWGESYIFNLVDFEGNVFVYKGSKYLHHENEGAKEGDRIEVRGKIKEHSIYKSKFGVSTKQTRLERIKVYNLIKGE